MHAVKRDQPYLWVTWLRGLVVGDDSCEWAVWFRTHFQDWDHAPNTFDSVKWNMAHTKLLRETRKDYMNRGYTVTTEGQNKFRVEDNGVIIGGKPDLIARRGTETIVIDVKTGTPRDADRIQVMLYMRYVQDDTEDLSGVLVYTDTTELIPSSAVDTEFHDYINYWLEIIANEKEPLKTPSRRECGWCNIGKLSCPEVGY